MGPKIRDWDQRDQLRSVGLSVDRFGAARELVDDGELDQSQHDISRRSSRYPTRRARPADLYGTVGGFSRRSCTSARTWTSAGRPTSQAPPSGTATAVVYHRGDFGSRREVEGSDRLELRHQAR
ncbi:MAG: hypothetical protein R2716_13395 [Microthrixaceae bacterium]